MSKLSSRPRDLLNELYALYWDDLCRYVTVKFGPGPPDPKDVAQQAFIRVAEQAGSITLQEPRAYLYRTAQNIVLDEHRRTAGRAAALAARPQLIASESDDFEPPRVLSARERLAMVERVVLAMPAARRKSLLLCRLHGLSIVEVARRTGYSESAVRKHLSLALAELEASLERES